MLGLCLILLLSACGGGSAGLDSEGLAGSSAGESGAAGATVSPGDSGAAGSGSPVGSSAGQAGAPTGAGGDSAAGGGGAAQGGDAGAMTAGGMPSGGSAGSPAVAGGSGGTGGQACIPRTASSCTACGLYPDGCNGVISCGACVCSDKNPCQLPSDTCQGGMCEPLGAGCFDAATSKATVCVRYPMNDGRTVAKWCPSAPPADACVWSPPITGTGPGCWVCNGATPP